MKVNLKTTNEAENAAATPNCHQRGQRTVNGIIGNTRRGIVIDKTLDPDSYNPVANKPVSTALAALAGQLANAEDTYQTKAGRADYVSKTYGDSTYATITQLGGKQDKLTAGTHITIEGTTISATRPENMALYGDLAETDGEFTGGGSGGGGGASVQSIDAYGEGGATTIEKGKISTDLTGVDLKVPFVLNIYEDSTLSGTPTRIVMTNKVGENNYLGTLDFINHYLVQMTKGTDGKYSYASSIVPNATRNTLFNKPILVPEDLVDPTPILPCTASDNGKVLSVVNGEAQWASVSGSGSVTVTFED